MPLQLTTILSLGIATNLDNVCIGIAYGLAGKRIRRIHNLLVSLISGAFAFVACVAAQLLSDQNATLAMIIGSLMLAGLGIYTIVQALRESETCSKQADRPTSLSEMAVLGVTLALNCLAASFGVGLGGIPAVWVGLSVMGFSYIAVGLGNIVGLRTKRMFSSRWLNVASGAILLLMGGLGLLI